MIHVIYTESYPKKHPKQSTTTYHAIIDPATDTEIYHEKIPTSLLPNNGAKSGYDTGMGFTMTQDADGNYYIFHYKTTSNSVQLEIFKSPAGDGENFTKAVAAQTLTLPDGTTVTGGYPIIGNSRDGSVRDNVIPMLFNSSTGPASGSTGAYYYFTVQIGDGPVEPAHTHAYTAVVTAPTCTEQGYTTYTCTCGDSYVDDFTDALGHDWDDGVVTLEPTVTTDGEKTFTCSMCRSTTC